jgi:hypothetical protein
MQHVSPLTKSHHQALQKYLDKDNSAHNPIKFQVTEISAFECVVKAEKF